MSISQIRDDLVTLLTPLVVDGGEVLPYPPDVANVFPAIWLADATCQVNTSMSDRVFDWTLPLTVAVARKAVYAEERAAVTDLMEDILAAIDANFTLGGTTYGVRATEIREGAILLGGESLVGFTIFFSVKQKPATAITG